MAKIEYKIDYDATGLITSQHIVELGTEDFVRFVTTQKTVDYLKKKKWILAIQRDPGSKNPFKKDLEDPYIVHIEPESHWILVEHAGKGFHWNCGYVDENNGFYKWPDNPGTPPRQDHVATGHLQQQQVSSIPFPT